MLENQLIDDAQTEMEDRKRLLDEVIESTKESGMPIPQPVVKLLKNYKCNNFFY